MLDWGLPFLGLVDNAAVLPKMVDMLSIERFGHVHPDCPPGRAREIRLDHDYLNVMRYDGSAGGTLRKRRQVWPIAHGVRWRPRCGTTAPLSCGNGP